MARYRQRKRLMAEINIVPYIDVMLVLLVIFMMTAPMSNLTQGVEVELPQANSTPIKTETDPPVIISIDRNEQLFLSYVGHPTKAISETDLLVRIQALLHKNPQRAILVRGDSKISHGKVTTLMAQLQANGVSRVGFMTQGYEK